MTRINPFCWNVSFALVMVFNTLILSGYGKDNMNPKNQQMVRTTRGDDRWFPGDKTTLGNLVASCIDAARVSPLKGRIIGAIAPHAGYIYSGSVAGYVYRALQDQARRGDAPDTVVILGFSHRGGFRGVALMDGDAIRSPLGETELDKDALSVLSSNRPAIYPDYAPHNGEHSAENQIPFVQTAIPKARLVVGLIGDHNPQTFDALAAGLEELAKIRKLLVIASSDMLHDPDYNLVTKTDRNSLKKVAAMQTDDLLQQWSYENQIFCGMSAVAVTMRFVKQQGVREGVVLHYRNTGDDHPESRGNWVVGYGAVVFPLAISGKQ